jgi:hypothetical protein
MGEMEAASRRTVMQPTHVSDEEWAIRLAEKKRIWAKDGMTSWQSASIEALNEYSNFLRNRTGPRN